MYVQIEKISPDRQETEFFEGYEWDTAPQTLKAFEDAKTHFSVSFEKAAYLVDLYGFNDDVLDTFPMSKEGYSQLPR